MSDIFDRLKSLYDKIDIKADEKNGNELAELKAVSNVLSTFYDSLSADEEELFLIGGEAFNKRQCTLADIDARDYEASQLTDKIIYQNAHKFCEFDIDEYERDLNSLNLSDSIIPMGMIINISGTAIEERGVPLRRVGRFFKQYLPPFVTAIAGRGGRSFDFWEAKQYRFADIDNFNLDFNFLETL